MTILHYTLGFSPYRSGGLVKYAMDLMLAQKRLGCSVIALYPGGTSFTHRKCWVHQDKDYNGITTFELSNPMPVPLMYGIKDIEQSIASHHLDIASFECLLDSLKPDVFHIHTLMGLPLEYIRMAKEKNVKIVYTSHDYFGLCPKVNFINQTGDVCLGATSERCMECNAHAKSALFLKIRNAKWVVPLKKIARRIIK